MNYIEQIREQLKNSGGIITSKAIRDSGIPTTYLSRMVNNGELEHVDRGIYINSHGDYDEYYFFSKRYQVPIFSYVTALHLFDFTELIPNDIEVTVYKGYNPHSIKGNVRVHYVSKEIYELGIVERETMFGNLVRTYDIERTICDLVKNRESIEAELFVKTMLRYARYEHKDLDKLYSYSKKMNVAKKVYDIMQLIL